jgi:predicted nuclease of predicted toxin-antitoxin system
MKLVVDTCIPRGVARELEILQHDVIWIGDWSKDPGDLAILTFAHSEKRIVVTADKDYGELAILQKIPHSGIVRLVDLSLKQQVQVSDTVLRLYENELLSGAIVTADSKRVRIRPAEDL